MALQFNEKALLESVRAACLAAHSSAGLSTSVRSHSKDPAVQVRLGEVARMLRSAEALCRSAAVLLGSKSKAVKESTKPDEKTSTLSSSARRRMRRRSKSQNKGRGGQGGPKGSRSSMQVDNVGEVASPDLVTPDGLAGLNATLNTVLDAATASTKKGLDPLAPAHFPVGTRVRLGGLQARPELNQQEGTIAVDSNKGDGRIAVALNSTGEKVRVKADNIILSVNQ